MAKLVSLLGLATAALSASLSTRDDSCTPGPITDNGRQCTIECGTDHPGGDYSALSVANFQGCMDACSSDLTCLTAQYSISSSYCYLKNSISAGTSNNDVYGIVCPPPASASTSSTPAVAATTSVTTAATTSVAPATCTPGTITINGRVGTIECDTDRSGGDYSNFYANSFLDCENACGADSQCKTAQYDSVSHYCYLKSAANTPVSKTGVWGIVFGVLSSSTTTPAPTTPPSTTTPKPTTTTTTANPYACSAGYVTINGRSAVVQCGFDYPGSDTGWSTLKSLQDCENSCGNNTYCDGAAWNPATQNCYMKHTLNQPVLAAVNAVKFLPSVTTSASPQCTTNAIDSPYILNQGFERGLYNIDTAQNATGSGGYPTIGNFTTKIMTKYMFEGCNAFYAYPNYQSSPTPQLALGVYYYSLQPGVTYTLSFIIGGFTGYNYNTSMNYKVYDGSNLLGQGPVCTYGASSSACVIKGADDAAGQRVQIAFTAQASSGEMYFVVNWTGSGNPAFLLDDVQINMGLFNIPNPPTTTTTTTTTSATPTPTCWPAAPYNSYIPNGGFENGKVGFNYYLSPPTGFNETVGTQNVEEGCNSLSVFPLSSNRPASPKYTMQMSLQGMTFNNQYTLSFFLGGYSAIPTNTTIGFQVGVGNSGIGTNVCGYNTYPYTCGCPTTGKATGMYYQTLFNAGYGDRQTLQITATWNGTDNPAFVMDDIRIMAGNQLNNVYFNSCSNVKAAPGLSSSSTSTSTTTSTSSSSSTSISTSTSTTTTTTSSSTTATSCVATYTTIGGRTGAVQCGIDRAGGDLSSQSAASLAACEALCAANSQCVTAQFTGGTGAGTCYLKSSANAPQHKSVDGILFYTTASTTTTGATNSATGCAATAPPNPYLMNGGWEGGYFDDMSGSLSSSGSFSGKILSGIAFEGCGAWQWVPTSNSSQPRTISFGMQYQGLQNGVTYKITAMIGRPTTAASLWKAPTFSVIADGIRYITTYSQICGFADSPACPIIGIGGAQGQLVTATFTASHARPYQLQDQTNSVYLNVGWQDLNYNDPVIVDDIRINPA